jgi:hypothetical protein
LDDKNEEMKPLEATVIKAYRAGVPVIVFAKDGSILHGEQTLRWIRETGAPIKAVKIEGIDREAFEAGELPEICEAAREAWLADTFPK